MRVQRGVVANEGCQLAFDKQGQGPGVLLVQGVGVHGAGWTPQTDVLSRTHACVTLDNRGMGRSQPVGAEVTVSRMAADALAVMDAVGWDQAHVVGHSLGGLVALHLALAARARVNSLALLCTFANGRAAAPLTWRMTSLGLASRVGTRVMRRRGFLRIVLPPDAEPSDDLAARLADLFGHDLADQPPVVSAQLRAMRRADVSSRLGELAGLPTLVVSAEHDPIAPPVLGRALATAIPGARFVECAGASHGAPITHAAAVNDLLLQHLHAAVPAS